MIFVVVGEREMDRESLGALIAEKGPAERFVSVADGAAVMPLEKFLAIARAKEPNYVITDLISLQELEGVRAAGGLVLRILPPPVEQADILTQVDHAAALDGVRADWIFTRAEEDLERQVDVLLRYTIHPVRWE